MVESAGFPPEYRWVVLESLPQVSIVHHVERDGTAWATAGRRILRRRPGQSWERLTRFPFRVPRDLFGWSRPTIRASRAEKCNVFVNSRGLVLAIRSGEAFALRPGGKLAPLFPIQGDCVLHGGICEDREGWTYVGEYFQNVRRGPVRIWRVAPGLDGHEVAHEFPVGDVRHVHGVFRDPYDEAALWATVGDYVNECYLVRTRDRFASVERFGDGTQTWRAVNLYFTPDHVCWLTDSHLEQNYACRMDRRSGQLEKGQAIACSAWFGLTTSDGLHISFTTVERGPGIQRNESSVLASSDGFHWTEIACFRKDAWRPVRVFKYGVISCPTGTMPSSEFYISGEGLVGLDGTSRRVGIIRGGDQS